jgi:cobalt/nickel transport system ATP-binding protein
METQPIFELKNVSYAYDGGQPALAGIDLSFQKGERVAILGANGSGKSTLLKLLDGLFFATAGAVLGCGQPLNEAAFRDAGFNREFRRRVSLVFQDSDVQLFCPSVWEEVAFGPLQLGLGREEVTQRVERALGALKIEKLRDRPPHRLSGGEKKRVALASVLSMDPEVWLMDEPTAGLDPRSQAWLEEFILAQGQAGRTVISATHDLGSVETIADRVVVFAEDHRLAAQGTPGEILSNTDLLVECNLIHQHRHYHPETGEVHSHPHQHRLQHDHEHLHFLAVGWPTRRLRQAADRPDEQGRQ